LLDLMMMSRGIRLMDVDSADADEYVRAVAGVATGGAGAHSLHPGPEPLDIDVKQIKFGAGIPKGGGYGEVRKGVLNGRVVAVKEPKDNHPYKALSIETEIKTLLQLQHPNIIELLGRCRESARVSSPQSLVLEWFGDFDLQTWCDSGEFKAWSDMDRLDVLLQVLRVFSLRCLHWR
jgi:hypothetical protein